jgi:L-ascorbate metabolism protein UlaG (beta-lactamase superfamily)
MMADLSKAKPADLILITDIHGDHYDPAAVAKLRKPNAPVVVPQAVADMKQIPNPTVMANATMRTNEQSLAGLTVISVPAYNVQRGPSPGSSITREGVDRATSSRSLTSLQPSDRTRPRQVYIAGDTECIPAMTTWVTNVNAALMPMNLPYTMTPAEAAACVKDFKPKIAIPYHYMGQNPQEFADALKGTMIEVRLLNWYPKS